MRKVLILEFIIVIVIVALLYFLTQQERIVVDSETDTTFKEFNPDFVSSRTFIINYTSNDTVQQYNIQKILFEDEESAHRYSDYFLKTAGNLTVNMSNIEIGGFKGYIFNSLGVESRSSIGFGLILEKEENLLYGFGWERENLIEVTEWFIENY